MVKEYRNDYHCSGNMVAAPKQTTYANDRVKTEVTIGTHKINGRGESIATFVRNDWWNGEGDAIMALNLNKGDFVQLEDAEYYNTKGKDGKWYHGHKGGTLSLLMKKVPYVAPVVTDPDVDPDVIDQAIEEDAISELPF